MRHDGASATNGNTANGNTANGNNTGEEKKTGDDSKGRYISEGEYSKLLELAKFVENMKKEKQEEGGKSNRQQSYPIGSDDEYREYRDDDIRDDQGNLKHTGPAKDWHAGFHKSQMAVDSKATGNEQYNWSHNYSLCSRETEKAMDLWIEQNDGFV